MFTATEIVLGKQTKNYTVTVIHNEECTLTNLQLFVKFGNKLLDCYKMSLGKLHTIIWINFLRVAI